MPSARRPRRHLPAEPQFASFGLAGGRHTATQAMARAHQHDEVELNFVEHGGFAYILGGERVAVRAGQLCVFWAAHPHVLLAPAPDTRMCWFTISVPRLTSWNLPTAFTTALLGGRVWLDTTQSAADALACARWLDDVRAQRFAPLECELRARLLRLAERPCAPPASHRAARSSGAGATRDAAATRLQTSDGGDHLEALAACIAARFREPLAATDIAAAAGLHPNYAMQLFRRRTGLTLHGYLERQRLAHARQLLATSALKVIDVAFAAGFGTASAFYAAFAKHLGCTPAVYRRRVLRGAG
jgi:AraC family transcriptional regulator, melibiose operon regulatory protein